MDPEFMDTDGEHQHDISVSSISFKFEGEVNIGKLQRWIGEMIQVHATNMFRYKGMLAVKGKDEKFLFQGVHMLFNGGFQDYLWRKDEPRECRFVFIGRNLDKNMLEERFMACKVNAELRFKVGDAVEANVGAWTPGKIIMLWDDGNPYRIELEDGENVWGPEDTDDFVRLPSAKRIKTA
jgi:hypothetical protein